MGKARGITAYSIASKNWIFTRLINLLRSDVLAAAAAARVRVRRDDEIAQPQPQRAGRPDPVDAQPAAVAARGRALGEGAVQARDDLTRGARIRQKRHDPKVAARDELQLERAGLVTAGGAARVAGDSTGPAR